MRSINPNYAVTIVQADTKTAIVAPMPATFTFDVVSEYNAPFSQGLFGSSAIASLARVAGARLTTKVMTAQIWQGSTEFELTLELDFFAESDVIKEVRDPILALMGLGAASNEHGFLTAPGPRLNLETAGAIIKDTLKGTAEALSYGVSAGVDVVSSAADKLSAKMSGNTNTNKTLNSQEAVTNGSNLPAIPKNNLTDTSKWEDKITNQISIMVGNYAFFDSVVITDVNKVYEGQIDAATGWPLYAKVMVRFKPLFLVLKEDLKKIFEVRSQEQLEQRFSDRTSGL